MASSSSSIEFGSANYQGDSTSYDSIEIIDTEYGKTISKAPRIIRHRFGRQRMEYLVKQLAEMDASKKSPRRLKGFSLSDLLEKYEVLSSNLGLEEAAINKYINPVEKVKDLIRLLTLLGKINETAKRCGSDFTLDILAELKKVHFWLTSKNKFNDKDKACVRALQVEFAHHYQAKIYSFLQPAIELHYTPYLLLFVIYGIRSLNFLKETPLMDQTELTEFLEKFNLAAPNKKTKSSDRYSDQKLGILIQFINQAKNCYQAFQERADESTKQPSFSGLFYKMAKEVATQAPVRRERAKSLYYLSEEVIKFAIFMLNDSQIALEKKVEGKPLNQWLNKIIVYFFEIRNEAFTASRFLQQKLQQDIRNYKLVEELVYIAKLDDVSYVYVNGCERLKVGAYDKTLECNTIQHNLEQTKHRKLIFKTHKDGNESVVLVQDAANQEGMAIRGKNIPRNDELLGLSIDQLRWRITNTLSLSPSTYLYHFVAGTTDPLTESQTHKGGKQDQSIERHYEFSEIVLYDRSILLGRDLFTEFDELHQQNKQKLNPTALLTLQVQFIEVTLQLVHLVVQAAKYNVYLTDIKPRNFLISVEDGKLNIKISDNKSYQTPDDPARDTLCSRYVNLTPGFHTTRIFIHQDDIKYVNLELLTRETLVFTLTQLLTLTHCDFELYHQGYQAQLRHLEKALSSATNPMLFQGPFGKEINLITTWMLAMFQDKAEIKDILNYFEQPTIKQRLAEAKAKIVILPSPGTPLNMSPDQGRDPRKR